MASKNKSSSSSSCVFASPFTPGSSSNDAERLGDLSMSTVVVVIPDDTVVVARVELFRRVTAFSIRLMTRESTLRNDSFKVTSRLCCCFAKMRRAFSRISFLRLASFSCSETEVTDFKLVGCTLLKTTRPANGKQNFH